MTKYQQGKVYCIKSPHTPNIYIGSTIRPLSYRMSLHNYHYRKHTKGEHGNISSFDIIKFGDAYIELIENFPCANKEELEKREGEIIRESPNSINNNIAGRTKQQYYEDNKESILERHKQYYEDNKESIREHSKQYYEDNKESIREYAKQYYEDNKEYYNQYSKQYRENNKESMKEYEKQYYQNNKESIIEKKKQYYENNKESIREYYKQYYQDNKESIREKLNEDEVKLYYQKNKIKFKNNLKQWIEKNKAIRVCICGKSYNYGHKQTRENHYKTQRHTNFVLEVRKNFII